MNKVWLITGTNRGIGAKIAKAALAAGSYVVPYLSPSRYEHINRLGKYSFTNPARLDPLHRRPLRQPGDPMA